MHSGVPLKIPLEVVLVVYPEDHCRFPLRSSFRKFSRNSVRNLSRNFSMVCARNLGHSFRSFSWVTSNFFPEITPKISSKTPPGVHLWILPEFFFSDFIRHFIRDCSSSSFKDSSRNFPRNSFRDLSYKSQRNFSLSSVRGSSWISFQDSCTRSFSFRKLLQDFCFFFC